MNITPASIKTSISKFLSRFHMLIFTILVLGGLVICMLLINDIIAKTGIDTTDSSASTGSDFDQATIDRIKQLHSASDNSQTPLDLSTGRINPFVD